MLFFDYEKIVKKANSNPYKIISLLKAQLNTKLYDPKLKGHSYLIYPLPVLNNSNIDISYIIQYLALAARRDYTQYLLYKQTSLPLSYFPDIAVDRIKTNPLLTIENNTIKFKYEG